MGRKWERPLVRFRVGNLGPSLSERPASFRKTDTDLIRQTLQPATFLNSNPLPAPISLSSSLQESQSISKSRNSLESSGDLSRREESESLLQSAQSDSVSQFLGSKTAGIAKSWIVKVVVGVIMSVFILCMFTVFTKSIPPASMTVPENSPLCVNGVCKSETEVPVVPPPVSSIKPEEDFLMLARRASERLKDEIEFKKEVKVADIERYVKDKYPSSVWENVLELKDSEGKIEIVYGRNSEGAVESWKLI